MRADAKRVVRATLAVLAAALALGVLDQGLARPRALMWVIAGLMAFGLPIVMAVAISGPLARRGDARAWVWLALGGLVSGCVLAPLLAGAATLTQLPVPGLVLFMGLPVVAAALVRVLLARLRARGSDLALAALLLAVPTAAMGVGEGLLVEVRPGSEALHLQLHAVAVLTCFGSAVPLALALGADEPLRLSERARDGLAALGLAWALVLLHADRTQMLGLYPHVHAWLQWQGGLALVAALALWGRRIDARVRPGWGATVVVGAVAAVLAFALPSSGSGDIVFRAAVARGPLGRTLLRLRPRAPVDVDSSAGAQRLDHPRLHEVGVPVPGLHLVLITVDTLRADALAGMPRLRALSERSLAFDRAYAPAPATFFSLPAILAGRSVGELDWKAWRVPNAGPAVRVVEGGPASASDGRFFMLADRPEAGGLAPRLREAGLSTIAVVDGGISEFLRPASGYADGFVDYEVVPGGAPWPTSGRMVDQALQRIDEAKGRWFLWLHLYDPHRSEREPQTYAELLSTTDVAIGTLVDGLRARGLWDRTALVLTADHGEAFGEHGRRGHDSALYEEQILVPLIVRIPGASPRRETRPASAIDAAPTLAALAGASTRGMTGVNLAALAREGDYPDGRPVFSEHLGYGAQTHGRVVDQKAVIDGDRKLIWDRGTEALELYDLRTDPAEQASMLWERTEDALELQGLLRAFADRAERAHPLP